MLAEAIARPDVGPGGRAARSSPAHRGGARYGPGTSGRLLLVLTLAALSGCERPPGPSAGETIVRQRILPLGSAFHRESGGERRRARVRWIEHRGVRRPAVVADHDTTLVLAVDELGGLELRGDYGLIDENAGPTGDWETVFRVSVRTKDGHDRLLLEDRVTEDRRGSPEPLAVAAPTDLRGPGEVRLEVDVVGGSGPRPTAAWLDAALVLPVEYPVRPVERPWNVVVVTADTTRADVLGPYGGPARTPELDRLAGDGVLFREAHSAGYGTTPSHASLFTGSPPRVHGVYDNETILDERFETLAEVLRSAGYRTAAFVGARPVARALGLEQGFLLYDDVWGIDPSDGLGDFGWHERRAGTTVDRFLGWLDDAEEPFATWLHFFDPHQPYSPPSGPPAGEPDEVTGLFQDERGQPRYLRPADLETDPESIHHGTLRRAAERRYAAEVEYLDGQLGRVLEALRRRGEYDRTLVVFVSDHGENFLDRGVEIAYRHPGLHADVTRLGLVVKLPHSLHAGEQRGFLLLNSDLSCLVADVVGVGRPSTWTCESFLPLLGGDDERPFRRHLVLEGARRQEVAIRTRRWLYREPAPDLEGRDGLLRSIGYDPALPRQLYDLDRDPDERENLAGRGAQREVIERLHRLVNAASEEPAGAADRLDSEEHRDALRALGYLDGGP